MRVSTCPTLPGRPETEDCVVQTPSIEQIQLAKQNKQKSAQQHFQVIFYYMHRQVSCPVII